MSHTSDATAEVESAFQPHPPAFHTSDGSPTTTDPNPRRGTPRRTFMGYVLAGSSLIVAGRYVTDADSAAAADGPSVGGPAAARPTVWLPQGRRRAEALRRS